MRVEVETDLKLPIPPPMLSIPPMEEEKEVKSTKKHTIGKEGKIKLSYSDGSLPSEPETFLAPKYQRIKITGLIF